MRKGVPAKRIIAESPSISALCRDSLMTERRRMEAPSVTG